ncbi:hypothetical protein BURCENBC7_AP2160 [Burkholderia cenocepacia BC7]|nr:hypothetical protein BURCENK562V_C7336 [Burkholderia cenocepacia K56-2Valvano]ERI28123.1 hypothetical protein BURCENBC7_AP2160 [Burkholderia cenocepacia BC7]
MPTNRFQSADFSFYFPDCENKQSATYIQNAIQIRNLAFIKIY